MNESASARSAGQVRQRDAALGLLYDRISGDEDARVCKDIPDAACRHLPRIILPASAPTFSAR